MSRGAKIHRPLGHLLYDLWRTSISYCQQHFCRFTNFLEPAKIKKISKYRDKIYLSQNLFCDHTFPVKICVVSVQCGNQFRPTGSHEFKKIDYLKFYLIIHIPICIGTLCSNPETICIDLISSNTNCVSLDIIFIHFQIWNMAWRMYDFFAHLGHC